jgi:hypothetical protein
MTPDMVREIARQEAGKILCVVLAVSVVGGMLGWILAKVLP